MKKSHWIILIFNVVYLLGFLFYYIAINNYEFVWYIFVIVILGTVIGLNLHRSHIDNKVLWLLSIWGLSHMIAGSFRYAGKTLYSFRIFEFLNKGGEFYILKLDQVIHFYGFFIAAILVYQLISATGSNKLNSPKLMIFLAWLGSMGLGALNEVVEFVAFVSFSNTGVGDLYNMGLDLVFNLFGALFGAFFAHKWYKNKK